MKKEQKFYICKHCGNIIAHLYDSGARVVCCGDEMTEIIPNTVDASSEKHVPVIKVDGSRVKVEVGSAPHPMTPEHYITWIYIQTEKGGQRKALMPDAAPAAEFILTDDDKVIRAYEYCNLHGLWKADA